MGDALVKWGGGGKVELDNIDVVLAIIMLLKYQVVAESGIQIKDWKRNNFYAIGIQ